MRIISLALIAGYVYLAQIWAMTGIDGIFIIASIVLAVVLTGLLSDRRERRRARRR